MIHQLNIFVDATDFGTSGPPMCSYYQIGRSIRFYYLGGSVGVCCRPCEHVRETWDARS